MQSRAIRPRIASETAIAAAVETTIGSWVVAKIAVTTTLGGYHYFLHGMKRYYLPTQILPAFQSFGTSNETAVHGPASQPVVCAGTLGDTLRSVYI